MTALATGTIAPDFTLHSTPDQALSLAELRGRPVVLVFYPADWSPVCGDQLALYNELRQEFAKSNAVLLALSVERALCVLDKEGVIRWSYVSPVGINPGADGILTALEALPGRA